MPRCTCSSRSATWREALAQALLERRVQLLVDRRADLLELLLVVRLDRAEPRLDRLPRPRPCAGRWPRTSACELLAERFGELLQRRRLARALRVGVWPALRARRACSPARASSGQRVGELLLHRRELTAEAVDLLVLRARHVALLRQQRLLEVARALARAPGACPARCARPRRAARGRVARAP